MYVKSRPETAILGSRWTDVAVGPEARMLWSQHQDAVEVFFRSEFLAGPLAASITELDELLSECSAEDWDGFGAMKASVDSYFNVRRLLEMLPARFQPPEISVDPDGEFGLDWLADQDYVFSISVGDDGRLSYAGRFGSGKFLGREYLGDVIPTPILLGIQQIQNKNAGS